MKSSFVSALTVSAILLPLFAAEAVDFEKEIQPILKEHCFRCHSGPRAKAKIRYDNVRYFKEVIGTDEHAIVVPGQPDKSKMLKLASLPRTATDAMPPPKARNVTPMNTKELALVRQWILEGASLEPGEVSSESAPEESAPTAEMPAADPNKIHSWTNTAGKTLKAAFVSSDGTTVTLRKSEDGSEFGYPLSNLSAESQKLAADLSK